jgi:anthranilate synthase component 1
MDLDLDIDGFADRYAKGKPFLLTTNMIADLETPVSAFMKLAQEERNSFLFESVEGGANIGRYSFLGFKPDIIWRCHGRSAEINRTAQSDPDSFEAEDGDSLSSLRDLIAESRIDLPEGFPPMASALVGFLAYDTVRLIEDIPDENPDSLNIPDGIFLRPTIIAVFDRVQDQITLFTPIWPGADSDATAAFEAASSRLAAARHDLEFNPAQRHLPPVPSADNAEAKANMTRADYHQMVEKAKEYIRAGDIFQVVPSQRFRLPFNQPPFSLYRALRRINPSPFLFFLEFGDFSVVGSSPEILVRVRDRNVTIRPIAGTRPRGKTPAEDRRLKEELLADPKELAEHLMLLDLGRNDVGRVSQIGTVKVTESFAVEFYSHVMHIVSNVEGRLRDDLDSVTALFAGFPAGTVSGAPKVRAMEIIDELEPERRGLYAGAVGYFGAGGDMDTCIALRTAIVKDGEMIAQAGGGVVADSDPDAEYRESCNKARALIRAAEEAAQLAARRQNG